MDTESRALGATLEQQGVKYLLPTYSDMHGVCKSKRRPLRARCA